MELSNTGHDWKQKTTVRKAEKLSSDNVLSRRTSILGALQYKQSLYWREYSAKDGIQHFVRSRCLNNSTWLAYHLDVHNYVLQVPLNDQYKGRKLTLLIENGTWNPPR